MDEERLQQAMNDLEVVNHRLMQYQDMVTLDENETKYLEETRQLVKKILNDLRGEEILNEIREHVEPEK